MTTLEELNRDCPEHDRTSCSDAHPINAGIDYRHGTVWCRRCEGLHQLRLAAAAAVVPAGWVIERRADGLAVIAPNCDPGGITLAGPFGSLPRRLLYRLAEAMLAAERKGGKS